MKKNLDLMLYDLDPGSFSDIYVVTNPRTWPAFPIIMPLKNGMGPATTEECDEITFEVWDQVLNTHGSFEFLSDAIEFAMKLNEAFFAEA